MRVLANPPLGVYDNAETAARHTPVLFLLDTAARHLRATGEITHFPARSYNLYGKKVEKWFAATPSVEEVEREATDKITKDHTRTLLGLLNADILFDTNATAGSVRDFRSLYEKGYLLRDGEAFHLDCPRIGREHNLARAVESIHIVPRKARQELEEMLSTNTASPVRITRDTPFAPANPYGGEQIGPLFVAANMWDHIYPGAKYTVAASHDVIGKYALLRLLCRTALDGNPGFDELLVWPRVTFHGTWDIETLITDPYHADMYRVSILSKVPSESTNVDLPANAFHGARNLVYLVANLRNKIPATLVADEPYPGYLDDMQGIKYPRVLQKLSIQARTLSREVQTARETQQTDAEAPQKYARLLKGFEPFMPATVALCRSNNE